MSTLKLSFGLPQNTPSKKRNKETTKFPYNITKLVRRSVPAMAHYWIFGVFLWLNWNMSENLQQVRHDARLLIVMRHAEADWGLDDFNRPLTKRGHGQAPKAGRWLLENGFVPEMLISSAALRTRQTTAWVSEGLGEKAPTASLDERLYNAPSSQLMTAVNVAPQTVNSLMLVAHWPGVQDLSMNLASPDSDYDALMDLSYGFEPGSLAVFEVLGEWNQLVEREARLIAFEAFN